MGITAANAAVLVYPLTFPTALISPCIIFGVPCG